jgi:ABC-2 type transport system ATP-binding protein
VLAIDLRDVTKTYRGGVKALRGVSLAVGRGEVFGLLGPNGAGKSTLVKIIMTVVRPTTLQGTVLGEPACTQRVLERIGYLPEHHRFPAYLTGRQVVDFMGALAKVPRAVRRERTERLLELVGMRSWGGRRVTTYSKGMQQRIGIAAALVNDPQLVVLDEPTDGVDPVGRKEIRDVLLEIRRRGKTVLLNTHILAEVEGICDRVAIMNKGRVVRQGTIGELSRGDRRYEFTVRGAPDDALRNRLAALLAEPPPPPAPLAPWTFTLPGAGPDEAQPVLDLLRSAGLAVEAMRPIRSSLEDIFMDTVREDGGGGPGAVTGRDA